MKRIFLQLAAIAACAFSFASCRDNGPADLEDPFIDVQPDRLEASFEGQIFEVEVESNCSWVIAKTDAEGTAVDWVKCDMSTGEGNQTLKIRVYPNETTAERRATVTLAKDETKAFIDITQGANPDPDAGKPDEPENPENPENPDQPLPPGGGEGDEKVFLSFDFTGDPQPGWPTQDKATRIHVDGGTTCTYTLDGEDYQFICADCDGAATLDVFWATTGKLYMSSQWRYFGLPVIEGKRLVKISCECLYYTASIQPKMGVVKRILGLKENPTEDDIVPGGEIQTWDVDETWYTFNLSETEGDTVYFIYCEAKGGWTTLELTYE